jgi:urease accessory protein
MRAGKNIATGATLLFVLKHPDEINDWLLWQLADSAFPTGGFAHSGGLEAAWQHGEIRSADDLASYLEACLGQSVSGMIPFVTAGHDAPGQILESNLRCEAFLSNHVANRASRLQGRAFFNAVSRTFGALPSLATVCDPCHFAPTFGAVTRSLSVSRSTAKQLFAFHSMRTIVSAAVRLGIGWRRARGKCSRQRNIAALRMSRTQRRYWRFGKPLRIAFIRVFFKVKYYEPRSRTYT